MAGMEFQNICRFTSERQLARSGGVICPPEHVDPEIRQPTPLAVPAATSPSSRSKRHFKVRAADSVPVRVRMPAWRVG